MLPRICLNNFNVDTDFFVGLLNIPCKLKGLSKCTPKVVVVFPFIYWSMKNGNLSLPNT